MHANSQNTSPKIDVKAGSNSGSGAPGHQHTNSMSGNSGVPPQSPLMLPRSGGSKAPNRVMISCGVPLITPCSPGISTPGSLLSPSAQNSASQPVYQAATRTTIPDVRDLRSSFYSTRICGQESHLIQVVRSAMQGQAVITKDGRVEIGNVNGSSITSPSASNSTTSTSSATPPVVNRIPSAVASSTAAASATPSSSSSPSSSTAHPRVYVGLSVGPGHGRVYFEGKMPWPIEGVVDQPLQQHVAHEKEKETHTNSSSSSASAAGPSTAASAAAILNSSTSSTKNSTPTTSTPGTPRGGMHAALQAAAHGGLSPDTAASRNASFMQLLTNLVSYLPPLPQGLVKENIILSTGGSSMTASTSSINDSPACSTPSSSTSTTSNSENSATSSSGNNLRPSSARGSRRSSGSLTLFEDSWYASEVVLSVFLLVDSIDIDSKQITFIAPCMSHGRTLDHQALFQALYKVDISKPNSKTNEKEKEKEVHSAVAPTSASASSAATQ